MKKFKNFLSENKRVSKRAIIDKMLSDPKSYPVTPKGINLAHRAAYIDLTGHNPERHIRPGDKTIFSIIHKLKNDR